MKLHDAYALAEKIKTVLAPFCEKIEIAGSIRRARPEVNDIDFVILPSRDEAKFIAMRALLRKCEVIKDGPQCMIVRSKTGAQIDIWFAHDGGGDMFEKFPSNWGSLLLCRTGSMEHNIFLAQRARAMELKWETSRGLVANPDTVKEKILASVTEEEIFSCLGLPFIPPVERERSGGKGVAPVGYATSQTGQASEPGTVSRDAPQNGPEDRATRTEDWAASFSP